MALLRWAEARPDVRVVLLTSTRARPGALLDRLSDYDVILVVDALAPFAHDRRWIEDFGDVLVAYWDPVDPEPTCVSNVVEYVDVPKMDFTVYTCDWLQGIVAAATLPDELDAGYRVLYDPHTRTAGLKPPTGNAYVLARPTEAAFLTLVTDFLSSAPYVAKCLWRDELLPAKWCLDTDMKDGHLRPLLELRIAMEKGWTFAPGVLGRGLKKHLPDGIWAELEATYVGADIAENWEALRRTLALFRRVGIEVAAHLGATYPEPQHQRVVAYVERVRQLP
jgi:aminoglycoside 6-adenylyltransferase